MEYIDFIDSKIGKLTIVANDSALKAIHFDNQRIYKKTNPNRITEKTKIWLENYFNNRKTNLNFKLEPDGTIFQKRIWDLLLEINYGEIKTYKDVKEMYEKKYNTRSAAIAVGQAVGKNPISIIIPCHRVIGSDGKLTGFGGGLDKKEILLKHENMNFKVLY